MASMFMCVDGIELDGESTGATMTNVQGIDSTKNWFPIKSVSWSGMRQVAMDIGSGNNSDSGMVAMSELNISKEMDCASEGLLSYLFSPGKEGRTVEIAVTKPERTGQGAVTYFQMKLEQARLVNYSVSGGDGSQPYESLALSYVKVSFRHNTESSSGDVQQGGIVTYDLPQGLLVSGAQG